MILKFQAKKKKSNKIFSSFTDMLCSCKIYTNALFLEVLCQSKTPAPSSSSHPS